jgi:beta-lactamase superfamily II metal-dependent hydrolase
MPGAIRVRMYRTGFGDGFLIRLGSAASGQHILIDFGVHSQGDIGTMDAIMDDIEKQTGKKLALLVASHAHRDHISGFGSYADRFAKFTIGEIWMPWTDDPKDEDAAALKRKQLALYGILDTHLRVALGATESNPKYSAALHALSNLMGNEKSMTELNRGFGTGAELQYLKAGASIAKVGSVSGLSAEILAPSKDTSFLSRMNPPSDQHFMTAPGDVSGKVEPFPKLAIRKANPRFAEITRQGQPVLPDDDLEKLNQIAEAPADTLALALDNVRNNTSLVIVFRFHGRTLLFPGDAQWGNWQSWIGTDKARQLIGELDFLKVAHHGSENATPVDVVNALKAAGLAAMVSTQVKPFPTIPRMPLLTELEKRCLSHIAVRSDSVAVANAPEGPKIKKFPKGFTSGKLWIDYSF